MLLLDGHRERLRLRMEREGWDSLKPHEMVEMVLFHAMPRQDLSEVSRLLVERFGSVGGVFAAPRRQLMKVPGMSPLLAEWIVLTGRMIRSYRRLHNRCNTRLFCYQDVLRFVKPRLPVGKGPQMRVLYADFSFNLITFSDFMESDWWDAANARRMMMEAIGNGAQYVYMIVWRADLSRGMDADEASRLRAIATTLRGADLDLVDCLLTDGMELYSMNVHGKMDIIRAESGRAALYERYAAPPEAD